MLPGMLGCEWEMRTGPGEMVSETAFVSARGSLQELQAVTEGFESLRLGAKRKGDLCLRIWSETRDCFLYSLLHQFDWQILPDHLLSKEGGSFSLKLNWERDNIFYGDEVSLPLSNTSGSGITNGLTIYNHDDASVGHDNWFDVNLLAIGNLLELPLRLELKNSTSGEPLADFWLGSMCLPGSGNLPNLVFEAENGVGGSVLADASASSGNYSRYDWSGSGWHSLASWTISSLDVTRMNAIGLLPLLRFLVLPVKQTSSCACNCSWMGCQSGLDLRLTWNLGSPACAWNRFLFPGVICLCAALPWGSNSCSKPSILALALTKCNWTIFFYSRSKPLALTMPLAV